MKSSLTLLLLLNWVALGLPAAIRAQCTNPGVLDFTAAVTPADDWKAHGRVTLPSTTLASSGYASSVATAGGSINTFAVGTAAGILPNRALVWQQDNATTTGNLATVTFAFSVPVSNLVLRVSDIDQDVVNGNFVDKITFNGFNTTSTTPNTPVVLTAGNFTLGRNDINSADTNQFVTPNSLQGIATSSANNLGTSTVTFPGLVDKVVLVYQNLAAKNGNRDRTQTVGIERISFCPASANSMSPLPVELTNFTVRAVQERDVQLDWTTASEVHSAYFDVERSLDGIHFVSVGQVAAQGSSSRPVMYSFTNPGTSSQAVALIYYRLRQVDQDASIHYSPAQTVHFASIAASYATLYPNPAHHLALVDVSQLLPEAPCYVEVRDATGRQVRAATFSGERSHSLDLAGLPAGVYQVLLTTPAANGSVQHHVLRLVKE